LEAAARESADKRVKVGREIAEVEAELDRLRVEPAAAGDLSALAVAAQAAQLALAEAEAAALRAEAAHSAARQALDVARQPLNEAERRVHRLETEARTLAKVLHVDAKKMWPPMIDLLTVEKGFETALGAALGDDLEAPIEPSAAGPSVRATRMETSMPSAVPPQVLAVRSRDCRPRVADGIASHSIPR